MAKDIRRKTRGSWWYGWVRYTYTGYDGTEREARRATDWDFATAGQALRAAEALAGALTAPIPLLKGERRRGGNRNDKWHKSRIRVIEFGASRAP